MICNNNPYPKGFSGGKTRNGAQKSAYASALALSHARIARLTGRPQ